MEKGWQASLLAVAEVELSQSQRELVREWLRLLGLGLRDIVESLAATTLAALSPPLGRS